MVLTTTQSRTWRPMRPVRMCFAAVSLLVLVGCSASKLDLRDEFDLYRSSFREKLGAKEALAQQFSACTRHSHGSHAEAGAQPEAASRTPSALAPGGPEDSIASPVHALIQRLRERRPQQTDSLLALQQLAFDLGGTTRRRLDLDDLRKVVNLIGQWHGHVDFDEDELAQDSSRLARLLLSYNKAYFGDLSFKIDQGASEGSIRGVIKVTSSGFVDRNGNTFVFPGLSTDIQWDPSHRLRLSATSLDSQRISADLTRIFLEAFFDTAFQVPAVHGATALRVQWATQEQSYPEFDAARPLIPLDALARVTRDAMHTEAAVTSAVGRAVRGGSVFGLQNETLAAMMETAAGVIAKKLVEHGGFCYFQTIQQSENRKGVKP
jgi:hypothetical protein